MPPTSRATQYSREDVDARSLANQYSQILGQIFTHEVKPMEVEILIAEVRENPGQDQMFHVLYDGTVVDEHNYSVLGGDSEVINERVSQTWSENLSLARRGACRGRGARRPRSHAQPATTSRSRCWRAATVVARFRRLDDNQVAEHLS